MAARGINVDNVVLQRFLDNAIARHMTKLARAGKLALKEISDRVIMEEFYNGGYYTSLPRSVKIRKYPLRQDHSHLWIDLELYVDEGTYLSETDDYYQIYKWADRHDKDHPWAANFVIDLQWEKGIIGLPLSVKGRQIVRSKLRPMLADEIDRAFGRKVKRYLKMM